MRIFILLLCFFGCFLFSQNKTEEIKLPQALKGYELYSWESKEGEWCFCLVTGTNRLKTEKEIRTFEKVIQGGWVKITIKGVPAIKELLAKLPKGNSVFWSHKPGKISPLKMVNDISEYSRKKLKIKLYIPQLRTKQRKSVKLKKVTPFTLTGIKCGRKKYSPVMSSIVGIPLTLQYIGKWPTSSIRFYWHTTIGEFLTWDPHSLDKKAKKIKAFGPDMVSDGVIPVFWSFRDIKGEKKPVKITLMAIDMKAKKVISTTQLEIHWQGHFAVVPK